MKLRKLSALLGAVALTFSVATVAFAVDVTKVAICHATDSDSNPYTNPTVNISSFGHLQGGHDTEHLGPIWTPTSKADKIEWGDIIPPYSSGSFSYLGHNWTEASQAIWAAGCNPNATPEGPDINIDKSADVSTLPAGGGAVTYTYVVTNEGSSVLQNISVSDNKCTPVTFVDGDTDSDGKLDLNETWTYTCTTTLADTTTNIGTVTATPVNSENSISDTDSATVTVTPSAPAIHIEKSASATTLPVGGGAVTYTYTVTNAGNIALTTVTVSDDQCSPVTYVSGDTGSANVLGLTETWIYTCAETLSATTTNVATAIGHDGQTEVTDTAEATVTVTPPAGSNPAIHIEKTVSPTTLPAGGGDVTYTFVVSNTGNVPVFDVNVRDDNGTPTPTTDDFNVVCPKTELAVAESMTCTALVSGTVETTTNTATVTANWDDCDDGCSEAVPPDSDSAIVTVFAGGVQGETDTPTAPPTDAIASTTTDAGGSLPILLIVLGIIGLGAVLLTPVRARR